MYMANSYSNILSFLMTTWIYYYFVKPLIAKPMTDPEQLKKYNSDNYKSLGLYFILVMLVQVIVNVFVIQDMCSGGAIGENIGAACLFTLIPWSLIFGVLIVILVIYPGFKSAFSDVIGYMFVAGDANRILVALLENQTVKNDSDTAASATDKTKMQSAADLVVQICGNTSVLINQIVPSNFLEYWNRLTPLMKVSYQNTSTPLKTDLFNLAVKRDQIGEIAWFIYAGILVISIVQLNLIKRGCKNNVAAMEAEYARFLKEEEEKKAQKDLATGTTYTLTD
jgi:hypothetical protein